MAEFQTIAIPLGLQGINKDAQGTNLNGRFTPNMKNFVLERTHFRKRLGYSKLGLNLPLQGIGMELVEYTDARGVVHNLAITADLAYLYRTSERQWYPILATVQMQDFEDATEWTGLGDTVDSGTTDGTTANKLVDSTQNFDVTVTVGDTIINRTDLTTTTVSAIDSATVLAVAADIFVSGEAYEIYETETTLADDSTNFKEQSNSLKLTAGAAIAAGSKIAHTSTFDDTDALTPYGATSHVMFWFRASKAGVSITVHVRDANTDIEVLSFSATVKDTWYHVTKQVDLSGITTATNLEIDTETALVLNDTINIDDIRVCGSFTGGDTNRFSHTEAFDATKHSNNGGSALCISNGIDTPLYYEGQSGDVFQDMDFSTFVNFAHTKEIVEFWNHFFCLNFNNADQNVRSYAFADFGNIDEFADGTSSSGVLTDSIGQIVRALKLGSNLIIYSDKSITACQYYGSTVLFVFPTLIDETGLYAPKAIWNFANIHYFLGTDLKIYGYQGGRQLLHVGMMIEDTLFSEIDSTKKLHIVTGVDQGRHKLSFFYPETGDTYAKSAFVMNYKRQNWPWEFYRFADTVRDYSIFSAKNTWYCDDEERKDLFCDEVSFFCDESFGQAGSPLAIFISDDGFVYQLDEATGQDDDANIECIYDTEDFTVRQEGYVGRFLWFEFEAKATIASSTIQVYYSLDSGETFTEFSASDVYSSGLTLTSTWEYYRLPLDITKKRIRYRIYQNSNKDVQLRDPMRHSVSFEKERE